ncbi:hypothetical protein [Amycolatopsis sp. DG1A-15b]|uniref:AfsR/SARP family transcriptional regulator n=1 Tax=Amycolatopsis sp. DG1A-15b TaxID=3052846 RepID=UPI00255BA00A|nr:hypothetical protein [Amycolatopsis sp. DG1A-15b]WIX92332.1 hypothetical protein QRY02_18545 [Amycolatopsis sp. DG1A-15b]
MLRLLGEVGACVDGASVDLGHPKQLCVLAALRVEHGRAVSIERLVERVWGGAGITLDGCRGRQVMTACSEPFIGSAQSRCVIEGCIKRINGRPVPRWNRPRWRCGRTPSTNTCGTSEPRVELRAQLLQALDPPDAVYVGASAVAPLMLRARLDVESRQVVVSEW